jgi:protocatechuate 3,4-dioxygenase beta subunit
MLNSTHTDDHDLGLRHDLLALAAQLQRRRALGLLVGAGATALITGCGGGGSSGSTTTAGSTTTGGTGGTTGGGSAGSCIAYPTETNGPFPADGSNTANGSVANVLTQSGIVRSDIRTSFGGLTGTAAGVPLTLTITLMNSNNTCSLLNGVAVYIWHCTADGLYSLYSTGATNQNFLRGVQVSDANGQVTFTTIFPGAYSGRYPHIHLEVFRSLALATNLNNSSLVSQLAMPGTESAAVYAAASGYGSSATNLPRTPLSSDNVFSDNSSSQITAETPVLSGSVAAGYTGTVTVGVPLS